MGQRDFNPAEEPLCKPHLVSLLKRRPKLFNIEAREKFLEELEKDICERRKPDRIAEKIVREGEQAVERPVAELTSKRLEKANSRLLQRL